MKNTKASRAAIAAAALALVAQHGGKDAEIDIQQLAGVLAKQMPCHRNTAKRHLIAALRGDCAAQWGGTRDGAGRPRRKRNGDGAHCS